MPSPYDYDLRLKAIAAVERGEKKITVCRLLGISRNTLDLWIKRKEKTGDCQAIVRSQGGQESKIKDLEEFRIFVLENQHETQGKIAELWGNNLTQQNVSYASQKLGITRKKKRMAIRKEMKNNGQIS
jgi:transposase